MRDYTVTFPNGEQHRCAFWSDVIRALEVARLSATQGEVKISWEPTDVYPAAKATEGSEQ